MTWIESSDVADVLPWLPLMDCAKWPSLKRLTSPTSSTRSSRSKSIPGTNGAEGEYEDDEEYDDEDDVDSALRFRFSGVDGGTIVVNGDVAINLLQLLKKSALTKLYSNTMYETFVQHTSDGLLEEDTFMEAVEELVAMTGQPQLMQDDEFLDFMLNLFRAFLPENCTKVDAFEIAAGMSLFVWGSKSDKLRSAFHYFDADSKEFLNRQQLWRFLRSILIVLLCLSPPPETVIARYGSIVELVESGEQEIMENVMDDGSEYDEDEDAEADAETPKKVRSRSRAESELRQGVFCFEDFGEWYNAGGFNAMSWLELLDLRKWAFVSPHFVVDELDVEPVDPVLASTNYYTAQNIRVDVDSGNSGIEGAEPNIAYVEPIEEVDEDSDDDDNPAAQNPALRHMGSSYSSATTVPSRGSGAYSTMPAAILKNEVVLEFDLTFDEGDDSTIEIPLKKLSLSNGDLIQYEEFQRITRLHELELHRVLDVFEPYMENPSSAWMEKSSFDMCITDLLPPDIAHGVASAFGVNSNTRVPPPSIGRAKDCKMVADTLTRVFFAFNRGGTGKIDLVEFVSAFTLFCAGSKSDKLSFAFQLFDVDGDGALTRREMWKYFRSFLTLLFALGNGSELSAEAIASVADATAIAIADSIFRDMNKTFSVRQIPAYARQSHRFSLDTPESADTVVATRNNRRGHYYHRGSLPNVNSVGVEGAIVSGPGAGSAFLRGGVVAFDEFARWYSRNGQGIAWVELLNAKKWPQVDRAIAEAILRYISRQQRAVELGPFDDSGPASGSTIETTSSNASGEGRERTSSMEADVPTGALTALNTERLRTADGNASTALPTLAGIDNLIRSPSSNASTARDLNAVALQFRLTSYDNTTLRIRLKDVATVYTISERMTLGDMACEQLLNLFHQHGSGRCLTKMGFLRAMRGLVPRGELSNEDQEFLSFHLLRVFSLFEAESVLDDSEDGENEPDEMPPPDEDPSVKKTSSVEKLQLLAGMSIFCGGSKSVKLGVLFKLFDAHGGGYVSRRHLFELLKSILVVLFAFSSYTASRAHTNDPSVHSWTTNSAAERTAGAVISKLFCEAKCRHPDALTLAEFAAWYANGGYMDCPWIELLDLSKWPAKEAFEASKQEKPLIYAFDTAEDSSFLTFEPADISTYLFMLRSTKLDELGVSQIYDALLAYATPSAEDMRDDQGGTGYTYAGLEEDEGAYLVITRARFYECVRNLVPKNDMSEKAQQTSSKLLSRIFNVFDLKRSGRVNALELVCGMSILGKGTKSHKLLMAFEFITKLREQRRRTLNNYMSMGFGGGAAALAAAGGGGGGSGNSSFSTGGVFGFVSARGAYSTTTGLRRSMLQNEVNALPRNVVYIYLRSFLLALMALSESTYRMGVEKMYAEADDIVEEAMGDLMAEIAAANGNNGGGAYAGYGTSRSRARVTFEQFAEWYNRSGLYHVSWIELLDATKWELQQPADSTTPASIPVTARFKSARFGSQRLVSTKPIEPIRTSPRRTATQKKQIRQSDIVSTPYPYGIRTRDPKQKQPLSPHRESMAVASTTSDAPILVFAIGQNAAELHFFKEDILRLKTFLHQTQLHEETSLGFVDAMKLSLAITSTTTMEVSRRQVTEAIQTLSLTRGGASTIVLGEEAVDLMYSILDVFTKEPGSSNGHFRRESADDGDDEYASSDIVDLGSVLCGLLVVCGGSLLDKLKCGVRLLDPSLPEHAVDTTMDKLQLTLMCFLLTLYGMSTSMSGDILRHSAQQGTTAVLQAFNADGDDAASSDALDRSKPVSLKDFSDWFSESGYRTFAWLELVDLKHWPVEMDIRGVDA
ncbi:hypothetical protein PINS_up010402 [Pythium insidiosum]|nr:hypothetical protein PINS_up010402 [Pythium insidiosum]